MANNKQSFQSYKLQQKIVPYAFLAPNLIIFSVFIILPAIIGVYYSFTDIELINTDGANWVWFSNYVRLFNDEDFIHALLNTFKLVIVTVPLLFCSALFIAQLLVAPFKAKGFFRATFYWPVMISAVVVGIIWNWIFQGFAANFSYFNEVLKSIQSALNWLMTTLSIDHQFTFAPMVTLGSEKFAWLSVVWAILWSRTGYYMIIFLAALLSIPSSLYEAAEVDGASKWQKFWYVTWPSLKSARLMVLILVTMEIFKTFPLVVTLTSGGPFDATKFAVMYIYERAFDWKEIGYASAMSVIMLIFVTIISVINFRFSKGGSNE